MARTLSPHKLLSAALEETTALVAIFNPVRHLVYANRTCGEWLGVTTESLIGREALFTSEPLADPLDEAVARIAPAPDAFAGQTIEAIWPPHPGETDTRGWLARFVPLSASADRYNVLLVAERMAEAQSAFTEPTATDWHAALAQVRSLLAANLRSEYLLGESPAMQRLRAQVEMASGVKGSVVVVGPRGCGREEIARVMVARSDKEGFLALQCSLQDAESLQEAVRVVLRRRSSAQPSPPALLLREVNRLSSEAQQELLGFLQLPGFDARIVATSSVSLTALARKGRFSSALAARLSTFEIRIPALADRAHDIPLLVQVFVERYNAQGNQQLSGLVPEAIEHLLAQPWPGNVQELEEAVTAACQSSPGPWLLPTDFSQRERSAWLNLARPARTAEAIQLDALLGDIEKELLARALQQAKGNKSEAARLLGISRPRLLRRLVQLGLVTKDELTEAIDFQPVDDIELPEKTLPTAPEPRP
jgi:DNA-binding NtrC family response regulator